jgi:hypothetical protein
MQNNDQIAIFESYKNEILKKMLTESIGDEEEKSIFDNKDIENEIEDEGDSEVTEVKEIKKVTYYIKNEEISVKLDPILREILRRLPDETKDSDMIDALKLAIKSVNEDLDDDDKIEKTPMAIFDTLSNLGTLSEEERDEDISDDDREEFPTLEKEDDVYSSDDDERFGKSSDFGRAMRRDVQRGELEDDIRRMGTDWRSHEEDFFSSNY